MGKRDSTAPLRRIVVVLQEGARTFDPARVLLECGHETYTFAMAKTRCGECNPMTATKLDN